MDLKNNPSPSGRLKRQLGLVDAITIGLGAVIGAGIFVVSGVAAGIAFHPLLLVSIIYQIQRGKSMFSNA